MIELNKIDDIANRLRQYEIDEKPRYFNLEYLNPSYSTPQLLADRVSGEVEFRSRVNEAINTYKAGKIIVSEFNQKSKNVNKPVSVTEIVVNDNVQYMPVGQPGDNANPGNEQKENHTSKVSHDIDLLAHYGGIAGFEQNVRTTVAQQFQLQKEQEEKQKMLSDLEELKQENSELRKDNEDLFEQNEELVSQIEELQKYVPENFRIGNLSVTKVLGSILGSATETLVRNVVAKKPDKVRDLLGETAFEQLAGLVEDDSEEQDEEIYHREKQQLQPVPVNPEQEDKHAQVADVIHELNKRITSAQLGKIQMIYYHFIRDNETIDNEKLNEIIQFINTQKQGDDNTE